ncbi:TIGR02186 family protein [Methylobacterium aquaticum]|uniref:TIGR02186 family protein n=1 Tax=Methylobacterium aquaticum TaxID=270351 RepID=UPI001FEE4666|nr:TIGR02186 family protein [Methylobacterium aquaticum]
MVFALLAIGPARAESLVVSLSFNRLAVTSSYTGASVAVFGAVERDGQAGRAPAPTTWW